MTRPFRIAVPLAAVVLLGLARPGVLHASGRPGTSDGISIRLATEAEHTFEQDLEGPGEVALTRASLRASLDAPLGGRLRGGPFAEYELRHYAFDGATGLVPGRRDPFDDLHRASLGGSLAYELRERWSLFVRGGATWAGESDAGFGGSLTFQGFGGARWQWRDDLSFTFGLMALTRLEDDPIVVPILGFDWRPSDRVRVFTPGPGVAASVRLADGLDLGLRAGWESRDYRLDGGRRGLADGVVRDDRVPLALELSWRRGPAQLSLRTGATVYQEFEIDDRTGDRVSRSETDPAPFLGLRGTFRF